MSFFEMEIKMLKFEIQYPYVCLNGTSADELVAQQRVVRKAAKELYAALSAAVPHPRDYQTAPDPNAARQKAYDEHKDRLIAAAKIRQDADRIIHAIHRQTGHKWWVDSPEETS